ncbi:S1 RNA-binding domain-containing protein [uncultured Microscilla sp.]|uniref:S1 RNA-binding domain-containing protein n=1 Tax=uncultured Microscilla sp. TaxID=432653 RepID=UPI00260B3F43|nr:S1 RNA-binding domain-containing protein [uncultured Microscilla sp.]
MTRDEWNRIINKFPIGMFVKGLVKRIEPYGLFISIEGLEIDGFIPVIEVLDLKVNLNTDAYQLMPKEKDVIIGEVLGHTDSEQDVREQVWLSLRGTSDNKYRLRKLQRGLYVDLPEWLLLNIECS